MDDYTTSPVNGKSTEDEKPTNVEALQNIVNKLEESNNLPSIKSSERAVSNGQTSTDDIYSLENTSGVLDEDFNFTVDSEDSWLYESPQKIQTPGKRLSSPVKWLTENITTPELMRVRGSLSAKLDVIKFEKRKGRFANTDPQRRKISQNRKESMNSVHSLDWEYDEDDDLISDDGYSYDDDDDFDVEKELSSAYNHLDRHAWSGEPPGRGNQDNIERTFSLDWSDGEEELAPMKINFTSPPQRQGPTKSVVGQNGTVVRRGGSGIDDLATPRQPENYDYDDFVARPTGSVKPRRAVVPHNISSDVYDETDSISDDFDDSAPVILRGSAKRDTPSPRSTPGIVKPVQRRSKPAETSCGSRPRGSANNLVKPRTSVPKSQSVPDMDSHLVAKLPAGGDGAVVRRRGAGETNGGIPAPRKSKESPQVARVQGIPQTRRSTGSIPQKNDGIPRPRRSASPSGIVRPRGSGLSHSVQANY